MLFFNEMRMIMKKIVSLILCLTLIASAMLCTAVSASAEGEEPFVEHYLHTPQITVTTENGNGTTLEKADGYVNAHIKIIDTNASILEDDIQFKVRGNSTASGFIKKKPFTFKFAKKKEVLGMGKAKKWALIADALDPTLLRNHVALGLGRELGLPYVSKQQIAELWVDGSYRGVYTVTVPVEAGKDRVDIDDDFDDGEIKDFLIELEKTRVEEGETYFTSGEYRFVAKEPEEPDENQLAYMQTTMEGIINTIKNGSQEEIEAALDVPSFVAFYVLNEFVNNVDLEFSSVFFFYKDGKLYAGPPWDYDFAMAGQNPGISANYRLASQTEGTYAATRMFFRYLCQNPWFMELAEQLFEEHYSYFYNIGRQGGYLDSMAAEYADEINRNYTQTGWTITSRWYNYPRERFATYGENLDFLKDWCSARSRWMVTYLKPFKEEYLIGDTDGDDEIDIIDATLIQRVLASVISDDDGMISLRGDIELNGLDVTDAVWIQRSNALISIPYIIGEPRTYDENLVQ